MKSKIYLFVLITALTFSGKIQAQMTWNQACTFTGALSSYIAVPHTASLDITGSFTLEEWINPANSTTPAVQTLFQKRANGNKGYTFLLSGGKAAIRTNSTIKLIGKTVLPNNQWTHIAGTYEVVSGTFNIYVNGLLDTSVVIAGAVPVNDNDSLLIGKGADSPFAGKMDEIRIWNRNIDADINNFKNLTLGTNTSVYSGLVLSMTFQNSNPAGTIFSLADWSGNNNNGTNKGVTAFDLSNRPSNTISINECANLDGNGDYISGGDNSVISPTSGITMEAWIFPRSFNSDASIFNSVIHKGNPSGSISDYDISMSRNKINFTINDQLITSVSAASGTIVPLNQWSHIAFTYNGLNGFFQYIKNGVIQSDDTLLVGFIHDNNDSLYIGGTNILRCFDGYIDEIRITSAELPYNEIGGSIYTSVNELNDPAAVNAVYNLDGGLSSNTDAGPKLNFRGDGKFSENGAIDNTPVSPMTFTGSSVFQNGFYIDNPLTRIPATGTIGFMISDTIDIRSSDVISDVNVFVALNHTNENNLIISLVSPAGVAVTMYSTSSLINNSDNIVTLFDDQADSSLGSNKYVMFGPTIKPLTSLNSSFSGVSTTGKWKLRIQDISAGDTGVVYAWGIQFNNQASRKRSLSLTSFIEGFYNPITNIIIPDTMRVYIRDANSPFIILDSAKGFYNSAGVSGYNFNNITINDGVPVFIELKHRNSIETWSNNFISPAITAENNFSPLNSVMKYDFTTAKIKAFGSNQAQVDASPSAKFGMFGGDVNQDGNVDLSDLSLIDNDAGSFVSGYVRTDLTGDNFVDISDLSIAENNAFNFVSVIRP